MINRLNRLSALQNPEVYKAQAMPMSTWDKPRIIGCADLESPRYVGLPRGCLDEAVQILSDHEIRVEVRDERHAGLLINASFVGELNPEQKKAAAELRRF